MNNFCEECGNKIQPGDLFCENCGQSLAINPPQPEKSSASEDTIDFHTTFFKNSKLKIKAIPEDNLIGIVLTNSKKLRKKFGESDTAFLTENLEVYLKIMDQYGVTNLVLDASENDLKNCGDGNWKKHVDLLTKGIKRVAGSLQKTVDFVTLLGGDEIVPMPVFTNPRPVHDDKDVDSDLPYSTLSVYSPSEKDDARMPKIACGRIPTGNDTTVNDIIQLWQNSVDAIENLTLQNTFGLSAFAWQGASKVVHQNVCNNDLYLSPGMTMDNLADHYQFTNHLHYFNLHGGNTHPYWLGDDGEGTQSSSPVVFSPQVIAQNQQLNVIGVEACYGARFSYLKKEESILLTALSHKTVSFAGSSRIAWGPANPPINLADIVIHDFLALLQKGYPAGEALREARQHVWDKNSDTDPATALLSMMEFNLFGDPALTLFTASAKSLSGKSVKKPVPKLDVSQLKYIDDNELEDQPKPVTDPLSPYAMVRKAVDEIRQAIVDKINQDVWKKYPDFKGIQPSDISYKFNGKTVRQLTWHKPAENIDKHLLVTLSQEGTITSEYLSK